MKAFEIQFRAHLDRVIRTQPVEKRRRMLICVRAASKTQKSAKHLRISMTDPEVHFLVKQAQNRLEAGVKAEEVRRSRPELKSSEMRLFLQPVPSVFIRSTPKRNYCLHFVP
jgi:hypothetical protein